MIINKKLQYSALLISCALTLSACFSPSTPQEVTQDFWEAVISNNPTGVVENSTLASIDNYDHFSQEWAGFQPVWGEIRINGNQASAVSEFIGPGGSGRKNRKLKTYLVQRNNEWLVDYDKTGDDMRGGALGNLFGKLDKLGDDLSKQLELSSDEFNSEMEELSTKLKALSDDITQEVSNSVERFAIELQQSIRKLENSINRALKDHNNRFSTQDKRLLQEVSVDLSKDGDRLSQPTVESIVDSTSNISKTQLKLRSIEGDSSAEFQQEWKDLTARIEKSLNEFLQQISKSAER